MKNEPKWSGVFVTLPGVDKAAHMWGSIDDPGGAVPMTHLRPAAKVADQQVGKIMRPPAQPPASSTTPSSC